MNTDINTLLQQNDLFFLPKPATRFKGESKDKGREKKKRRMQTIMGVGKGRTILGKKKKRVTRNPEPVPAHRAAGMAGLTGPV